MTDGPTLVDRPRISGEPEWIEASVEPAAGADPLGLQTITTDRLMPQVAPGILALSDRARYFSFYSFVLQEAARRKIADQGALSRFMKEREFELALAVELCPRSCGSGPNGALAARAELRKRAELLNRGESVESYLGGYGLYYRSPMWTMGLIAPARTSYRDTVLPVDVLFDERADGLADSFRRAVSVTEYVHSYFGGVEPIPRPVLVEYASRSCLCRLDEMTDERDAIRSALFEPGAVEPAEGVRARREAFALLLALGKRGWQVDDDRKLRHAVWSLVETEPPNEDTGWDRTLARWAAVAGRDYTQEAIANLWVDAGRALLAEDAGDGLDRTQVRAALAMLIRAKPLTAFGQAIAATPALPMSQFRERVLAAVENQSLAGVVDWATADGSALAGLGLLVAIYARLPELRTMPDDWTAIAAVSGERQPGLLRLGGELAEHLKAEPSLLDTLGWAVNRLVLLPHEWTANSKVPEFTYRFRWEAGRLVFYSYLPRPFARFGLNDIHARSLTTLSIDLGFQRRVDGELEVTSDGVAFSDQVFAE